MFRFLLSSIIILCVYSSSAQLQEVVKPDSIIYPVHKENMGKIAFMSTVIPIDKFIKSDFLKNFEWKENADLSIRIFMRNSLTNYLHQLAPELSVEELNRKGNFQFTFYVDGKQQYYENLHWNSGTVENKNKRTVLRIPLISSTNEDSWGRFLWNRFMQYSGDDVFTAGDHVLKIEIRPYILLDKGMKTGKIIAEGELHIHVPVINIDDELIRIQAVEANSGWTVSQDDYNENRIEELNRKIAENKFKDITSIVVIKDGKLLLEEYFNGSGRDTLHDTRSVGKSFASALTGIAIGDGYIKSENQTLKDFYNLKSFPNYSKAKEEVTIRSLLTMSSGFDGSDMNEESPGNEEKMYPSKDWVDFALSLPMDTAKENGSQWDYFTAGVVLLGDILHKSVPGGLEKYADEKLFQPLGIKKYKWQYTPKHVVNTAGGLQVRSLDLARFGQLYKNNGKWNDKQVIPESWVRESLKNQIKIAEGNERYGYLFWNKFYSIGYMSYEVFYASGNGGNKIFIFKDQPVVIVITSKAFNTPYGHSQVDKMMLNYLIPALIY